MLIQNDKYNIVNYLKNYGSDVFDPIDYYKLNRDIYDKNFLELIKYILCLNGNKCNQLAKSAESLKRPEQIPQLDVIYIDLYDLINFRRLIRELILLINDLYKIFVMLYNLEMGFAHFVENLNYDALIENKNNFEEILSQPKISEEDIIELNRLKPKKKFIPMEYKDFEIYNIDTYNEIELIALSELLLEESVKIEDGIIALLKVAENIKLPITMEEISKNIVKNIIPENYLVDETDTKIKVGGSSLIQETYDNLFKLKSILDGVTLTTFEKEIPTGINITIERAKQIMSDLTSTFTSKIENQNFEINKFEKIPNLKGVQLETQNEFQSNIPEQIIIDETNIDIFKAIDEKIKYFNRNIPDIKKVNKELKELKIKIQQYKKNEIEIVTDKIKLIGTTNIGTKEEVQLNIDKKQNQIKDIDEVITKQNALLNILNNKDYKEYVKLKEQEKKNSELGITKKGLIDELKKNMFEIQIIKGGVIQIITEEIYNNYIKKYNKEIKEIKEIKNFNINDNFNIGSYLTLETKKEDYINLKNIFEFINNTDINATQQGILNTSGIIHNNIFKKKSGGKLWESYIKIQDSLQKLIDFEDPAILSNTIREIESRNTDYIALYNQQNPEEEINKTILNLNVDKKPINLEIEKLNESISNVKEIPNFKVSYKFEPGREQIIKQKIIFLRETLDKINRKMEILFLLKDNISPNPLQETNISTKVIDPYPTPNWFSSKDIFDIIDEPKKGGAQSIIKFSVLNEKLKTFIIQIDNYKEKATDLFEIYLEVVKDIQYIIIYLYYKLTVMTDISSKFIVMEKFTKNSLIELKGKINSINRKNFNFIREVYSNIIDLLLNKLTIDKYIEYDVSDDKINSTVELLVLYHLKANINTF
jgi:hypothetical protein